MTPHHHNFLVGLLHGFFAARPVETVADWCCRCLVFDEPKNNGPFNLVGSEYMREQLDAWSDPTIRRQVHIQGSQTRKTGSIMGGAGWSIVNNPTRIFWVMPTQQLGQTFSKTRWIRMLRKSPVTSALIPTGNRRHDFKAFEQQIGSSIVNITWSNSPSALSSIPAPLVILDEVDKFATGGGKEADAVNLAEQRTKSFPDPKIVATSTPTLVSGLIWQEFLKTDQRRRFLPCPHCTKFLLLVWSKNFTVFKITGAEAFVRWDKEAKNPDGTWDLDRVERSARYECPHCGGHILDAHKTVMDRSGEWRATSTAARGHRGWHLPSMYAAAVETNVGRLAVKFLQGKTSLMGLQGFVNGELAEPWENQDTRGDRIEIITGPDAQPIEGAVKFLTVDVQLVAPYFWFIVREWNGHSRLLDFGPLETWEEVEAKQREHGIADNHVGPDSKHRPDEVFSKCLGHGVIKPMGMGKLPMFVGWTPLRGTDEQRRQGWKDPKTGQPRPYSLGYAPQTHRRFQVPLLEFGGHQLKHILSRLRQGRTPWKWEVCESVTEEYWKHLDAEYLKPVYNSRTHRVEYLWVKRSRQTPNHMLDCEVQSLAMAFLHRKLPFDIIHSGGAAPDKQAAEEKAA